MMIHILKMNDTNENEVVHDLVIGAERKTDVEGQEVDLDLGKLKDSCGS